MKSFAIMSDQHYHNWSAFSSIAKSGRNNRLNYIISETMRCAEELESHYGGNVIYCAGDMFHVRGQVEPSVMNPVFDCYAELISKGFEIRIIPGNHDLATNETTKLGNAMQSLEHAGAKVCTFPTVFPDHKMLMIPWHSNLEDVKKVLINGSKKLDYAIIHAPLNNVIKGIPDKGLDPAELASYGYKKIFCGHYHNYVNFNNKVYSIGSLTHQTWSDVDTQSGFLVVDKGYVEHHESEAPFFIDYDNAWGDKESQVLCEGNYVRIKLGHATESEIKTIKDHVLEDLGALGCIVDAIPVQTSANRVTTVSSGTSIAASVFDWVRQNADDLHVDAGDLQTACKEILDEVNMEAFN